MSEVGERIEGVVIGIFLGFDGTAPLVVFPGNPQDTALPARSIAELSLEMIGTEVALLFEDGDPLKPLIVGKILGSARRASAHEVVRDDATVTVTGEQRVELRCGLASIILDRDGRITIRGSQVTSQASGTNRVRGSAVHLN